MNSSNRCYRVVVCSLLLTLLFATVAAGQAPPADRRHSPPEPFRAVAPRGLGEQLAATAPAVTIYVETYGTDSSKCGTQRLPCRTIEYGIYRAQQVQPDPLMAVGYEELVTVQVGPGNYEQQVVIGTADRIKLVGAGAGSTIVTPSTGVVSGRIGMVVRGAGVIYVEGFTFSGPGTGVQIDLGSTVWMRQCEFTGNSTGVAVLNATAIVHYVTFSNNGRAVLAFGNSVLQLSDFIISGGGTGVGIHVEGESSANLFSSTAPQGWYSPSQPARVENVREGMSVESNGYASLYKIEFTGNEFGVAANGAAIESWESSLHNNTWGILLINSSRAALYSTLANDNSSDGAIVLERSFLRTYGGEVTGNGNVGINLAMFSQAVIDPTTNVSGNGAGEIGADAYSAYIISP